MFLFFRVFEKLFDNTVMIYNDRNQSNDTIKSQKEKQTRFNAHFQYSQSKITGQIICDQLKGVIIKYVRYKSSKFWHPRLPCTHLYALKCSSPLHTIALSMLQIPRINYTKQKKPWNSKTSWKFLIALESTQYWSFAIGLFY